MPLYEEGVGAVEVVSGFDDAPQIEFTSLRENTVYPRGLKDSMGLVDFNKKSAKCNTKFRSDRVYQLHLAFQAIDTFRDVNGILPETHSLDHISAVVDIARELNNQNRFAKGSGTVAAAVVDAIDQGLIRALAACCRVELSPFAALFGAIAASETSKFFTKTILPTQQYLYFDSLHLQAVAIPPTDTEESASLAMETSAETSNRLNEEASMISAVL